MTESSTDHVDATSGTVDALVARCRQMGCKALIVDYATQTFANDLHAMTNYLQRRIITSELTRLKRSRRNRSKNKCRSAGS